MTSEPRSTRQVSPQRWEQIKSIFEVAVDLDPAHRDAYLDSACSGDQALQKEVESLLSSDKQVWELLERPAYETAADLLEAEQPALTPGDEVGHYKVVGLLGSGGMAEVYLARDKILGREIALKVLPADYLTRDRVQRFQQEARAASALNHPNIVTIYEISQIEGRHFIATEFIDGETLRQRLHRGRLTVVEALEIGIQVAGALAAAHRAGIVHRDVKPENIMLRSDGYVKVLDFGLAKLVGQPELATEAGGADCFDMSSGLVMGTVKYMSPEQARGVEVDSRSDIFSLIVVLYEMVTGRAPFEGQTTRELVASILEDDPAPLSQYSPQAPTELQRVVSKALRKAKEDRYQTIPDLLADLKSLKAKLELEYKPRQIRWSEYIINEVKRHRTAAIVMMAVLFISASAFVFVTYKLISQPKSAASSQNIRVTKLTNTGRSGAAVISPDGKYVAYLTSEDRASNLWVRDMATESNVPVLPWSGTLFQGLTFSPDGNYLYYAGKEQGERDLALYRIPAPFGGAARKLIAGVDSMFSISPDGNSVTFVRDERELIVANLDGSGERKLATRQLPDFFYSAAWSPDGKRIACHGMSKSAGGDVVEVEVEGGIQRTITEQWGWIQQVAWLTDGSGLVLSASDKQGSTMQLWQVSYPGGEIRRITTDLNNYHTLSLTADSHTLVTTQNQQVLNLWVVPPGEQERAKQITTGSGKEGWSGLAWTPDGRIVYSSFASGNPEIWIMDADGSNKKQLTVGLGSNSFGLSVSPDGRYILFISSRAGSISRVGIDGSNPKQLTNGGGLNPLCSPDSQWVYYFSEGSQWKVPIDGGEPVQLTLPYSNILGFSPDGNVTAYLASEGQGNPTRVGITSFEGGEPITVLDRLENARRLQWAPDSSALTYFSSRGGASNIWSLPIAGGTPKRLTDFEPGLNISSFAWSRDGKQLAVARGEPISDVVLIRNFR